MLHILCFRQCNEVKNSIHAVFMRTYQHRSCPSMQEKYLWSRCRMNPGLASCFSRLSISPVGNLQVSLHGQVDWSLADRDKQIHWHWTLWHHFIPRPITPYWSLLQFLNPTTQIKQLLWLTFTKPSLSPPPDTHFQPLHQLKHHLKVF